MTCKLCLLNDPRCKCSKSATKQPSTKTKESNGDSNGDCAWCGYTRSNQWMMCTKCPDYQPLKSLPVVQGVDGYGTPWNKTCVICGDIFGTYSHNVIKCIDCFFK